MKYYYGNSYKEAITSNPIEVSSAEVLEQYKKEYSTVIPATILEDVYEIALAEDSYYLDDEEGILRVNKEAFDEYEENALIRILFVDEDNSLLQFKMVDEDDDYIYLEYFGD